MILPTSTKNIDLPVYVLRESMNNESDFKKLRSEEIRMPRTKVPLMTLK